MVSRHLYTDLLYFRHITHQRRSDRYVCPLVYLEIVNKLLLCLHLSFSHILFLTISITARHPSYRPFLLIPCFIGSFSLSHPISLTFPSLLLLLFAPSLLQLSYMYCHLLSLSFPPPSLPSLPSPPLPHSSPSLAPPSAHRATESPTSHAPCK